MGTGDEVGLSEELYVGMIGRYAAAVEILTKRIFIKDQRIAALEAQLSEITDGGAKKEKK